MSEDKLFEVPERMIELYLRPFLETVIQERKESIASFFCSFIRNHYLIRMPGTFTLCTKEEIVDDVFRSFLLAEFIPSMGINPGEHSINETKELIGHLICDLYEYYESHTDTFKNGGSISIRDGKLVAEVPLKPAHKSSRDKDFVKAKSL